jgi:uncharacterized OB-fold protein
MSVLIQRCDECGRVNYPARTICRACLSDRLSELGEPGEGVLLATSLVHRSLEPAHAPRLPLRIGTVRLDCGPHVLSFVAENVQPGARVRLSVTRNAGDEPVWLAEAG